MMHPDIFLYYKEILTLGRIGGEFPEVKWDHIGTLRRISLKKTRSYMFFLSQARLLMAALSARMEPVRWRIVLSIRITKIA